MLEGAMMSVPKMISNFFVILSTALFHELEQSYAAKEK
jgi:hypothetical protein